jgi:hypothetical protein
LIFIKPRGYFAKLARVDWYGVGLTQGRLNLIRWMNGSRSNGGRWRRAVGRLPDFAKRQSWASFRLELGHEGECTMGNASRGSGWDATGKRGAFDIDARRGDSSQKSCARDGEIERETRGATLLTSRRSSGVNWR